MNETTILEALARIEPGSTYVLEVDVALNMEQRARLMDHWTRVAPDSKVVILERGCRLARVPQSEDLARIEGKLDTLIAALAEDEEPPAMTLDGEPAGGERDRGQSLDADTTGTDG